MDDELVCGNTPNGRGLVQFQLFSCSENRVSQPPGCWAGLWKPYYSNAPALIGYPAAQRRSLSGKRCCQDENEYYPARRTQ